MKQLFIERTTLIVSLPQISVVMCQHYFSSPLLENGHSATQRTLLLLVLDPIYNKHYTTTNMSPPSAKTRSFKSPAPLGSSSANAKEPVSIKETRIPLSTIHELSTSLSKTDDDNKKSAPSFRRGATPRLLLERFRAQKGTPMKGMRVAVSREEGILGGTVQRVIYDGSGSSAGVETASSTCKIVVTYDDNDNTETLDYPDFVNGGIALLGHSTTANVMTPSRIKG